MNASMGVAAEALVLGIAGRAMGWNDQNFRPFSRSMTYFLGVDAVWPSRGSGAPIFTQASKSARMLSASLPLGGMAVSGFVCRIARTSLLRAGLPGTMIGP